MHGVEDHIFIAYSDKRDFKFMCLKQLCVKSNRFYGDLGYPGKGSVKTSFSPLTYTGNNLFSNSKFNNDQLLLIMVPSILYITLYI